MVTGFARPLFLAIRAGLAVFAVLALPEGGRAQALSPADSSALAIVAAVATLATGTSLWPGYDPAHDPVLLYVPDRWTVLLGPPPQLPDGFEPYPSGWPALDVPAAVHHGRYEDLFGQLAFDVQIAGTPVAAIPLGVHVTPDANPVAGFGFVIHEAFHQFQHGAFAAQEETESEERYPILDAENAALATLELRLLAEATGRLADGAGALAASRQAASDTLVHAFLAVRAARWGRDAFLSRYESVKERNEGTAKYVEVRGVGRAAARCRDAARPALLDCACAAFQSTSELRYLQDEFRTRLAASALGPADIARNWIYAAGAAVCLLLDRTAGDWKVRIARADTSLVALLAEGTTWDRTQAASQVAWAKTRYDYDSLLATSRHLAQSYERDAVSALERFDATPGTRVVVEMRRAGLARSRSCRGDRWLLDRGRRVLSEGCAAYSLRRARGEEVLLEVRDRGVLDEQDEERGLRRVTFFSSAPPSIAVDGKPVDRDHTSATAEVEVTGEGFRVHARCRGAVMREGRALRVRLEP